MSRLKKIVLSVCAFITIINLAACGQAEEDTGIPIEEFTLNQQEDNVQTKENAEMGADELLNMFLAGSIAADSTLYITDLDMDSEEWGSYSVGERVDLDNDGENEQIICGPYGGIYLDARNNAVYAFAEGEGTGGILSYVVYNGAVWIMHSNSSHAGYQYYYMEKYEGADNLVSEMDFGEETVNDSETKYTLNGAEISYDEYYELGSKIFATEVSTY